MKVGSQHAVLVDAVPQTPWDFSLLAAQAATIFGMAPQAFRYGELAFAGRSRRSGCIPAEPYHPTRQRHLVLICDLGQSLGDEPVDHSSFACPASGFDRTRTNLVLQTPNRINREDKHVRICIAAEPKLVPEWRWALNRDS
jgi:hypothetical protein